MKIKKMLITELKAHEKNNYYFDDITGKEWTAFVESIDKDGIVTPVLVGNYEGENIIISGHQRVRAWKEAGKKDVPIDVNYKEIDNPDTMVLELIETNLKQRGNGNPNPVKMGRCIKELERLYGIRHGGDRKSNPNNSDLINGDKPGSQAELAALLGMSVDTLAILKKLADMPEEVGTAITSGLITQTSAYKNLRSLSEQEQISVISQLMDKERKNKDKTFTDKEVASIVSVIKSQKANKRENHLRMEPENLDPPIDNSSAAAPSASDTITTASSAVFADNNVASVAIIDDESIEDLKKQIDELRAELERAEQQKNEAGMEAARLSSKLVVVENNYTAIQNEMVNLLQEIEEKLLPYGLAFDVEGNIVRTDDHESVNTENTCLTEELVKLQETVSEDYVEEVVVSSVVTAPVSAEEMDQSEHSKIPEDIAEKLKGMDPLCADKLKRINEKYKCLNSAGKQAFREFLGSKKMTDLVRWEIDAAMKVINTLQSAS